MLLELATFSSQLLRDVLLDITIVVLSFSLSFLCLLSSDPGSSDIVSNTLLLVGISSSYMELVRFGFLYFAQNPGCMAFIPQLISLNAKKGLSRSVNLANLGRTDFTSQVRGTVLQLNRESRGTTVF